MSPERQLETTFLRAKPLRYFPVFLFCSFKLRCRTPARNQSGLKLFTEPGALSVRRQATNGVLSQRMHSAAPQLWLCSLSECLAYATIEFKAGKGGTQLVIPEQGVFLVDSWRCAWARTWQADIHQST